MLIAKIGPAQNTDFIQGAEEGSKAGGYPTEDVAIAGDKGIVSRIEGALMVAAAGPCAGIVVITSTRGQSVGVAKALATRG